MNFTELQTFIEVADHGSFSKAALALHISQPAISKRIQVLEESLDVVLFDRVGKNIILTSAGALLYPQAQNILQTLQDAQRQLRNLSQTISGELRLATSHHIGLHRLAPVLNDFVQRYPDVQLNISFEDSEVAHQMALRGEIEFAIVTLNPEPEALLEYKTIWQDPLYFVTQASPQAVHKKAKKDKTKNDTEVSPTGLIQVDRGPGKFNSETISSDNPRAWLSALAQAPCVLPGTNTYTGRIVMQQFAKASIELTPTMSTNYLETIGMLVGVGLGWGVLPASMIGSLQKIDVPNIEMSRTLGWVANPNRSMSNAARAFYDVLLDYRDK